MYPAPGYHAPCTLGPQVVLAPSERAKLALKASPYDRSLRTLDVDGDKKVSLEEMLKLPHI